MSVFICYSHKDKEYVNEFIGQCSFGTFPVSRWDDSQAEIGGQWRDEVKAKINDATIAALFISPDFLASEPIREFEVPLILDRAARGLTLFPIYVRSCLWDEVGWLAPLTMIMGNDRLPLSNFPSNVREGIMTDAVRRIISIIRSRTPATPGSSPPVTVTTPQAFTAVKEPDLSHLPLSSVKRVGREAEIEWLNTSWEDPNCRVICLEAPGGMGKSTVVSSWLAEMKADNWRGATRIYGWSFYNQGQDGTFKSRTVSDHFIKAALSWFGDTDPERGSIWQRGERLAQLINSEKTLLVLDGMEPLQHDEEHLRGLIKDAGLAALIAALAGGDGKGLCVITSRVRVFDLGEFPNSTDEHRLEFLAREDCAKLLKNNGVIGKNPALERLGESFGYHALAIRLLGSWIKHCNHGEVDTVANYIRPLTHVPLEMGRHSWRVLQAFSTRLPPKQVELLRVIALFDRPADSDAISAVRSSIPRIKNFNGNLSQLSEKQLSDAADELESMGLLNIDRVSGETNYRLDTHPLVRSYFHEDLRKNYSDAWRMGHLILSQHYADQCKTEYPQTLEEMSGLYMAISHGCAAGQHEEVFKEIYWKRIQHMDKSGEEYYSTNKLNAYGAALAALISFFQPVTLIDGPWERPVRQIPIEHHPYLLTQAAFALRSLGRLKEALDPQWAAFSLLSRRPREKREAIIAAINLSELLLLVGRLQEAKYTAEIALELAVDANDSFLKLVAEGVGLDADLQINKTLDPHIWRKGHEAQVKENETNSPEEYFLLGRHYCDYLLDFNRYEEVYSWVTDVSVIQGHELDRALNTLSLAQALMGMANADSAKLLEAETKVNEAIILIRNVQQLDDLPRGLLVQAELLRIQKRYSEADRVLTEATRIATRGDMALFIVDINLEKVRLALECHVYNCNIESLLEIIDADIHKYDYQRRWDELQVLRTLYATMKMAPSP